MPEDRSALLAHFRRMRVALTEALEGLSDAAMVEPSLDGWSVKDHLAHLALWDELRAAEVVRISAGHETAWRMNPEQEALYSAIGYELRQGLSLAQVRWECETTHQRLLEAISATTERGLDAALYGEAALPSTHETEHTEWIVRWRKERGL